MGDECVVSIVIEENLTVAILKDKIKETKMYKFPADKLQLFLAKKDGQWLRDDDTLDAKVLSGADTSTYMMMRASWKLNMPSLFAPEISLGEGVIHVLVVIPEGAGIAQRVERSANVVLKALRDSTDEWLAEFHTSRIKFDLLPSIASLPKFIEQPLPVKIRVPRNVLASWSSFPISLGNQVQKKMFVENDAAPCESFRWLVLNPRMLKPLRNGTTDNSFIWFWDTMIRSVLDFMFSEADIGRDSSTGSSTTMKRPDFSFILNEVCVFRGEEKEPGVNINLPRSALEKRLIWSYGKMPYLFGYAASGFKIGLFALIRGTNDAAGVNTFQLGLFNLEDLADRFRMVLALLNLCLLFPAISEECPDSGRNEYRNIHRFNGVVVRLNPTYIEKVFPNEEGFDQLERIYRIIVNGKVPNVDRLIKLKRTKKTAKFEPRGTMVKPSNLLELFVALRNVLEALIVLHRELVIHRDIRWPNVIKQRDYDAWFLIDFADAAIGPQHFPNGEHLSKEEHAPEIFVSGSIHTTAVDIWAVGYLIETSGVQWDDFARRTTFTKRLLQEDPTKRPTAEEALRDLAKLEEETTQEHLMIENLVKTQIQTRKRKQEKALKRKNKR